MVEAGVVSAARAFVMDGADWEPAFSRVEIARELASQQDALRGCAITDTGDDDDALCRRVAAVAADFGLMHSTG